MTGVSDTIEKYQELAEKTIELRSLLIEKMIRFEIVNEDVGQSFSELVQLITPQSMDSIVKLNTANVPIYTEYFNTEQSIKTFLQEHNLTEINIYIIKRIQFYCNYFKAQLINMGMEESILRQAKTLKDYIILLDKVKRVKHTKVILKGDPILYTYMDNPIYFDVYDDTNEPVREGILEIYRDNEVTPTLIDLSNFVDTEDGLFSLYITNKDPITYRVKFLGTTNYKPSIQETYNFTIEDSPLKAVLTVKNITTTSEYYNTDPDSDDEEGYMEDRWRLTVNVKDVRGNSINQPVPFVIYLQNKNYTLYEGRTDNNGIAVLDNFEIPYHSSDFIDFNGSTIQNFIRLDAPQTISIEEALDDLYLIKNLQYNGEHITFDRVFFTRGNYLDELNGCVKNITLSSDGHIIGYETFYSENHIRIADLSNPREVLNGLVTEVGYITDETNSGELSIGIEYFGEKYYEIEYEDRDPELALVLETELHDEYHPDAVFIHSLNIYHHPIKLDISSFTWYAGTDDIPEKITVFLYNIYTGDQLNFFEEPNTVLINDVYYCTAIDYHFDIMMNDIPLDYGENDFKITFTLFDRDGDVIISYVLDKTITILSNFEIPEKTIYYYEGPNIYYKPKGRVGVGYQAIINNKRYTTNANGLLSGVVNDFKDIGTHHLDITGTNGIAEQKEYNCISKIPFELTQKTHQRTVKAEYELKIYDKDHVAWTTNSVPTLQSISDAVNLSLLASDNTNQTPIITNPSSANNEYIVYGLKITPDTHTGNGNNTLKINMHGYEQSDTFTLFERLFELIGSNTLSLGQNTIQIKVNDSSISSIKVTTDHGTWTTNNKTNNIFTVNVFIDHITNTNIQITDNIDTEFIDVIVPKLEITPTFVFLPTGTTFDYQANKTLSVNVDPAPISKSYRGIYSVKNVNNTNKTITIPINNQTNTVNITNTLSTDLKPGTYVLQLTFTNDQYDDIIMNNIEQEITINKLNPNISIVSIFSAYDETNTPK